MISDRIKKILKKEKWTVKELAEAMGKTPQNLYNFMHMEGKETASGNKSISIQYNTVEEMLDILGYELIVRNKETGEIIE